jgi:uncharacterized membrane protein
MKHTILTGLLVFSSIASAQTYKIIDLGQLIPVGINVEGEVAGNLNGDAAIWTSHGGARELGRLSGGTFSHAAGINDLGAVAGTADGPGIVSDASESVSCDDLTQPFLWTPGRGFATAPSIPLVFPFGPSCDQADYANGVNLLDQVVGSNMDFATYKYGFLWGKSGVSLFTGFFQTNANAINDFGLVAGQISAVSLLNDWSHASFWKNGAVTDLGTLPANASNWSACSGATSMNDLDQIVGWSGTVVSGSFPCDELRNMTVPVHAFIWQAGTGLKDLGTLPGDTSSVAQKVNLLGVVVGSSGNTVIADPQNQYSILVTGHPFMWSKATGMRNLNSLISPSSGWTLNTAVDINVWGQVVGSGTLHGETHGYLLTPSVLLRY